MYVCLLTLTDVHGLSNLQMVKHHQDRTNAALHEYCTTFYAPTHDKFGNLLCLLPEIRRISYRCEDYLYQRHQGGDLPENTLLMEMLNAKRK